jgi:hypothetical protein
LDHGLDPLQPRGNRACTCPDGTMWAGHTCGQGLGCGRELQYLKCC